MENENLKKTPVYVRVLNIVAIVLFVIVAILGITALTSIGKGYNSFFGTAIVSVKSGSMESELKKGDTFEHNSSTITCNQAGFNTNDLIFVKALSEEQAVDTLTVGDVITYKLSNGVLMTHRIVEIIEFDNNSDGIVDNTFYQTKGDANLAADDYTVETSQIVGIYTGHRIPLIGAINNFLASTTGFLILVVIPCFLCLGYTIYRFVVVLKLEREQVVKSAKENAIESEKERLRKEIIDEMKNSNAEDTSAEPNETEETKTEEEK